MIECQGLTKHYGGKPVLRGIDVSIAAGEPVALVGPNGAGKTTFFSILCAYIFPSGGSVTLFGHKPGSAALQGRIASLPQDARLDPLFDVQQQLSLFGQLQGLSRRQSLLEAQRVLELVQLSEVMRARPSELSHGMGKRLSIAQALIATPELILLDEPTAGLDPNSARSVRQLVSQLSDQVTFIISSHNLQELERLCQTVLVLADGKMQQQTSLAVGSGGAEEQNYLTVHMEACPSEQFIARISELDGVRLVTQKQKNEYIIEYEHAKSPYFDQQLLKFLAQQHWHYRGLVRGKTLEDKLFS